MRTMAQRRRCLRRRFDMSEQLLREKADAEDDAVKPPWTKYAPSLPGPRNHVVRR
jgi:hypothetical protein